MENKLKVIQGKILCGIREVQESGFETLAQLIVQFLRIILLIYIDSKSRQKTIITFI